ncbi:cilia- and flagella-associated protein 43 [Condylostylus longicornis]|uniref:cilia- and flagella-associated protein 43 n=1 Tax=Condylostylus longicornis TaxID=2530218 RepID=UPI00244E084B|nr:cilia- and flagella-associated protein 43 [Condylostylus longicornis]
MSAFPNSLRRGNIQSKSIWSHHITYTEPTFIKEKIFAYHCDDTITFFDLATKQQTFYYAFGGDSGDGVSCITGHNNYFMFAFAELKYKPNIYMVLYPNMQITKILPSNHITKYIDIRFTDSEYIIGLTGYPLFAIAIWNYRKGIIMGEYRTEIMIEKQKLICGSTGNICAQYCSITREINIWEINSISEKVFLIKKNIKLTSIKSEIDIDLTFGLDGNLYLIDSGGIFYMIQGTNCILKKLWIWDDKIESNAEGSWFIETHKGGFLILSYNSEKSGLEEIGEIGPFIKQFALIQPYAKNVALLLKSNQIRISDIVTGTVLSKIQVNEAIYFKSYPTLPVLIVGHSDVKDILNTEDYMVTFDCSKTFFIIKGKIGGSLEVVKLYGIQNTIMTWGLDGIVSFYDFSKKSLNYAFSVQNRRNEMDYIISAQCTPNQKHCFILTKKGTLKCFTTKEKIPDFVINIQLENYFINATTFPYNMESGRSWIEEMSFDKFEKEKIKFASKREKIMDDLQKIREKVQALVDENEALEDPDDRVPLSSLNVAKEYAQRIIDKAKKNREAEDKILKEFIAHQNRITSLILSQTWSHMLKKNQKVFEISSDIWYAFLPPWQKKIYDPEKRKSIEILQTDVSESIVGSQKQIIERNQQFALSGTATHIFIDPHPAQYHQFETTTFNQMYIQEFLVEFDVRKLKQSFNKIFEKMIQTKEDTLKYVRERNDRFRVIQTEQNALALLRGADPNFTRYIEDPEVAPEETPESVTKVEETEIKVKPYISPTEQRLMEELAQKEELRRLALLADDFRERALTVMMDGVLEKRWEDEIKKDVPKPQCLLKDKDPNDYTKDDHRALKEYEEKVEFICSERERYRVMLDEEDKRLQIIQDENILKFNQKCGELFLQKLQYDAAVKQEELKLLRTSSFNYQRIKFKQKEVTLINNLTEKRKKVDELTAVIAEIEKKFQEYQQKYEQLQNRDKGMEKGFKSQYAESAPAFVLDTAYKSFKRRPKWQQKASATATIYNELANIIISKSSLKDTFPLPPDCYEYLNLLENNDHFSQAPSIIDQKLWEILCRLRRAKIDSEFRLKALGLQLAEIEATLNLFIKEVSTTKSMNSSLEKDLRDLNFAYQDFVRNRTVQIVMPMGLVEVPLTGKMSDFQGSLLLSRADIDDINTIIKKTGQKKLKTMYRLAVFRRKVLMKEWEHTALQMSVQDLKDFLNVVEHTNVTFEMRQWLREKSENRLIEVTNSYLRRKVEAKLQYLNRSIKESNDKIDECITKIKEQKIENSKLDRAIKLLNIDVTEKNLNRDLVFEEKQIREQRERMVICMERSRLIRKVQAGHLQILELATLLELQKLKTYPTLNPLMKNLSTISNTQ